MGSTPEELNTEIAGTREALANDMDALQDRVSPQAIVDRRKAATRSKARELRSRVMGSPGSTDVDTRIGGRPSGAQRVEGNPLAAGAIAFLGGILVSAAFPASDAETRASQKAVDTFEEHGDSVKQAVSSMGSDMAGKVKDSADEAVQHVTTSAQESVATVRAEGQSSVDTVKADVAE